MATREVTCPGCRGTALYSTANAYRPFCSQRCRDADLGAWASETFRVPVEALGDDELPQKTGPELH